MRLSVREINKSNLTNQRKVRLVQEGSGCYFIQEPNSINSRRFELRMKFPKGGNTVSVPIGKWKREINSIQDAINLCSTIRNWSNVNNRDPREWKNRNQVIKSKTILKTLKS